MDRPRIKLEKRTTPVVAWQKHVLASQHDMWPNIVERILAQTHDIIWINKKMYLFIYPI